MTKTSIAWVMGAGLALAACVPPQQQQQPQYGQPQYGQPQYGQAPYAPPQAGQAPPNGQVPGAPGAYAPPTGPRQIWFNGHAATAEDLQILAQLEQALGRAIPNGSYWYDNATGAAGYWGGPTVGFLRPNLRIGGPLPANASGGGNGSLTGIFINGRELHPQDRDALIAIYGQALPGRWWVDAMGNAGQEGGPAVINLIQAAQQRQAQTGSRGSYYRSNGSGNNVFAGGGCVAVNTSTGSGDSKKDYSYYSSGCE